MGIIYLRALKSLAKLALGLLATVALALTEVLTLTPALTTYCLILPWNSECTLCEFFTQMGIIYKSVALTVRLTKLKQGVTTAPYPAQTEVVKSTPVVCQVYSSMVFILLCE